jgi:outer membrane protein assembly factor BamB
MKQFQLMARLGAALVVFSLLQSCSWLGRGGVELPPLPPIVGGVTPRVAWTVAVGDGGIGLAPVAVGTNLFAASSDGSVVRLDGPSGRVLWRASIGRKLSAGVGSDGLTAAVVSHDGGLVALDGRDGKVLWTQPLGGEVLSAPAVATGKIVVRAGDRIIAFSAQDGKPLWTWQRAAPPLVLRQPAPVAIASELVYAGLPGGRMVALSLESGLLRWEGAIAQARGTNEIERIVDVLGEPWISGREVCAAAYQGRVACLDAGRGTPVWTRDLPAWSSVGGDPRLVFIPDDRGNLHALRRDTGEPIWKQEALSLRRLSPPLSIGSSVLIGDREGILHWFARDTGAVQARRPLDSGAIQTAPVAVGNLAVVQTMGGRLVALATD